jgi:hypothetical protein
MKPMILFIGLIVIGGAVYFSPTIYKAIEKSSLSANNKKEITVIRKNIEDFSSYVLNALGIASGIAGLGLGANHINKKKKAKSKQISETPAMKKEILDKKKKK